MLFQMMMIVKNVLHLQQPAPSISELFVVVSTASDAVPGRCPAGLPRQLRIAMPPGARGRFPADDKPPARLSGSLEL